MQHVVALVAALVLNAAANLLMKVGMKSVADDGGLLRDGAAGGVRAILTSPVLLIGLTCFVLNALCYMFALQSRALKISLAYPIMVGGGYALIVTVARWHPALRETLTIGQMVGVALVLVGIVLIATQSRVVA